MWHSSKGCHGHTSLHTCSARQWAYCLSVAGLVRLVQSGQSWQLLTWEPHSLAMKGSGIDGQSLSHLCPSAREGNSDTGYALTQSYKKYYSSCQFNNS